MTDLSAFSRQRIRCRIVMWQMVCGCEGNASKYPKFWDVGASRIAPVRRPAFSARCANLAALKNCSSDLRTISLAIWKAVAMATVFRSLGGVITCGEWRLRRCGRRSTGRSQQTSRLGGISFWEKFHCDSSPSQANRLRFSKSRR
jgi:hypothetical protein